METLESLNERVEILAEQVKLIDSIILKFRNNPAFSAFQGEIIALEKRDMQIEVTTSS